MSGKEIEIGKPLIDFPGVHVIEKVPTKEVQSNLHTIVFVVDWWMLWGHPLPYQKDNHCWLAQPWNNTPNHYTNMLCKRRLCLRLKNSISSCLLRCFYSHIHHVQCAHYGFNSCKQCIWLIKVQFIEYGLDFVTHLEPSTSLFEWLGVHLRTYTKIVYMFLNEIGLRA